MLFAFDPQRKAIFLVAGDKAGKWDKWYRVNIPPCRRSLRRSPEPTRREVRSMGISLEDVLAKRPVRRNPVEARKARMFDQVRAYRLKVLRKAQPLTQKQVAERLVGLC